MQPTGECIKSHKNIATLKECPKETKVYDTDKNNKSFPAQWGVKFAGSKNVTLPPSQKQTVYSVKD